MGHGFDGSNFNDLPSKQGQFWPASGNAFQLHVDSKQKNTQSQKFDKIQLLDEAQLT